MWNRAFILFRRNNLRGAVFRMGRIVPPISKTVEDELLLEVHCYDYTL